MILVIGYGNPLGHDDGLGQEMAHCLLDTVKTESDVSNALLIIPCCCLFPELVRRISDAESVIFISATECGQLGTIVQTIVDHSPGAQPRTGVLTPATLMHGVRSIYKRCPEASWFSVGGTLFDFGKGFSPEVEAVIPTFLTRIRDHINILLRGPIGVSLA